MASTKVNYRILHENGAAVYFQVIDSNLIPLANFAVAYGWFNERALTTASELDMLELINDPRIMRTYEKFLDEERKIFQLTQGKKKGPDREDERGIGH